MNTDGQAGMADDMKRLFIGRLKTEVAAVGAKRRRALWTSVGSALAVFAALALAMHRILASHSSLAAAYDGFTWPFYILLPLAFGVLTFSIIHILALRSLVTAFRSAVLGHVADFVDPGLVYEGGRRMAGNPLKASLLFSDNTAFHLGDDHFRGATSGGSRFEVCEFGTDGPAGRETGLFFLAELPRRGDGFALLLPPGEPASLSGIRRDMDALGLPPGELVRLDAPDGWQFVRLAGQAGGVESFFPDCPAFLNFATKGAGVGARLSHRGGTFCLCVSEPRPEGKNPSYFLDFDFARLFEFCRDVRICLEVLRRMERGEGAAVS